MLNYLRPVFGQARVLSAVSRRLGNLETSRSFATQDVDHVVRSPHADCPLPDKTVFQRLCQTAIQFPNNVAIECGLTGRNYTYDQLCRASRRFGSCLTRMGFKRGDVLAMVLPNVPEFPVALLGAAGVGMPVALINPIFTADEIASQVRLTKASVIVGIPQMADVMRRVAQLCPSIRQMILVGGSDEGFASLADMLTDSGDLFDENIDIDVYGDTFVLPHSSGTTGLPKSVMLTNATCAVNVQQCLVPGVSGTTMATSDFHDVYVCILPFNHVYGLVAQMLTAFETAAQLVTLPRFQVETFFRAIDNYKPTCLHVVPPLLPLLTQYPALNLDSFRRMNFLFCGGAPLGATLAQKVLERFEGFSFFVQQGYGLSETSPCTHVSPINNVKLGSIGGPIPLTRAKIVDMNTGEALGPHQEGELCVLGPQIMKGYLNNPEATKEMIDASGWLHTGDIAYYDDDQHFFVVDRLKDLIKVKGNQVSPSELENVIRKHPAVLDVGVIGVPDDYAGELPRAYVVTKLGASLTEEELKNFVHPKVAPHKQLKGGVHFVAALPQSNTGKVLRRELKAEALKQESSYLAAKTN